MNRNPDGPRLIRDGPCDRLADPPCGVCRELVSAAVFKFIDRLHQADIAFLNEVEELQAAVRVLFRDRDHQAEVGFDHLLLGAARFALALLDGAHDAPEFWQRHAGRQRDFYNDAAQTFNVGDVLANEIAPDLLAQALNVIAPVRVDFETVVVFEELFAVDLAVDGEAKELTFGLGQFAVQLIKLLHQLLNSQIVQMDILHQLDQGAFMLLVRTLGRLRDGLAVLQHRETLVLGTLQFVIGRRDVFEGFQDLGLELHFHLRERNIRFAVFVVFVVAFLTVLVFFVAAFRLGFFFGGFGLLRFDFLYDLFLVFCRDRHRP